MVDAQRNEFQPDYLVQPCEVLCYELEQRGMNQRELARRTGLSPKHIVDLVKGKSRITPETAIKLERSIGMPVDYWLTLEAHYQEALARHQEEESLDNQLEWLQRVPVKSMVKLRWIKPFPDKREQLKELLQFFSIASVDQWGDVWRDLPVAYRQYNKHEVFPEAVSAWLRRGELEAASIACKNFDRGAFQGALDQIRALTALSPDVFLPQVQELCAAAGVAVAFVPALPKIGITGATRWLSPVKALIQLSLCHETNDRLWFTFFHGAGHIMLHGKRELFLECVSGSDGLSDEKEHAANAFAQKALVPRKALDTFISERDYSQQAIREFAEVVSIAPGIIVGQLQQKRVLGSNQCNQLKCRYKWADEG